MSEQTHKQAMPPVLHSGGRLDFQDAGHLSAVWERELSSGRLTAINAASCSVFDRLDVSLNVSGSVLGAGFSVEVVFAQGDVLGLDCHLSTEARDTILARCKSVGDIQADQGCHEQSSVGDDPVPNQTAASPEAGRHEDGIEQGSLRSLAGIQDALLVRHDPSLFSLLRDLQTSGRYGRLTLLSGGEPQPLVLSPAGALVSFKGDFRQHLLQLDGFSSQQLYQLPQVVELNQLMVGLQISPAAMQEEARRAFNRAILDCLVDTLGQASLIKGAHYVFEPGQGMSPSGWGGVPFSVYGRHFLQALSKKSARADLDSIFEFRKEAFPSLVLSDAWYPGLLRLNEGERRFVDSTLNKGRNLRQLLTLSPLNRRATIEFVAMLAAMGLLEFSREQIEIDQTETIVAGLNKRVERASQGYFEALDVHASAHWSEYEAAFERMNARYGTGTPLRGLGRDVASICDEIMALVKAACAALDTKEARVAYRSQCYSQTELRGFAQLLLDKLKLAILREDNQQAVKLKAMALELAPRMAMMEMRKLLEAPQEDDIT